MASGRLFLITSVPQLRLRRRKSASEPFPGNTAPQEPNREPDSPRLEGEFDQANLEIAAAGSSSSEKVIGWFFHKLTIVLLDGVKEQQHTEAEGARELVAKANLLNVGWLYFWCSQDVDVTIHKSHFLFEQRRHSTPQRLGHRHAPYSSQWDKQATAVRRGRQSHSHRGHNGASIHAETCSSLPSVGQPVE